MEEKNRQSRSMQIGTGDLPKMPHFLARVYDSMSATLAALAAALEVRDNDTQRHCQRVALLAFQLAESLDLSELACHEIYLAGLIHDIGKLGIPDAILHKPSKLSDEEMEQIRRHPEMGYRIVEKIPQLQFALPGILYHHEQWDGGGYPHGLAGHAIPLMARVLAVADTFDAMTTERAYSPGLSISDAVGRLAEGRGKQWDLSVVDQLQFLIEHD